MKKLLLYIVLLSYAVVMVKPVIPYISDFIGHTLFYAQHISTMHYENGKYHIHAALAKETKDQKSDKTPSSSKKQTAQTEHVKTAYQPVVFILAQLHKEYSSSLIAAVKAGNYQNNYPPPRV